MHAAVDRGVAVIHGALAGVVAHRATRAAVEDRLVPARAGVAAIRRADVVVVALGVVDANGGGLLARREAVGLRAADEHDRDESESPKPHTCGPIIRPTGRVPQPLL